MPQPPDPGTARSRHRHACLDGLRGVAALMVALSHFVLAVHPALLGLPGGAAHFAASVPISQTAAILLFNPQLGVALFFVLSGFVLAASVAARPAWLPELVLRRWLRLTLPVLATSLVIWAMLRAGLFFNAPAAGFTGSPWLAPIYAWVAHARPELAGVVYQSLVEVLARGVHWYNPVLWTMPIEFWGSLAIFAAYALLPGVLAAAEGGVFLGLLAAWLTWGTPYAGFAHGLLLFEAMRAVPRLPEAWQHLLARLRPWAGPAVLGLGLLLGGMPFNIDPAGPLYIKLVVAMLPHTGRPMALAHDIGAALIVAGVLLWPPAQRLLATRPLLYLGRTSFMLYVVHVPVLCSLVSWLLLRGAPALGYNALSLLLLAVFLAASLLAADLATRLFDAPAIRLAHRAGAALTRRLRPAPGPLPAPAPPPLRPTPARHAA